MISVQMRLILKLKLKLKRKVKMTVWFHGLSFVLFNIMFLEYAALNQVFCNFCLPGYSLKDARKHMRDDHGLRENHSDFRSQLSGNSFFTAHISKFRYEYLLVPN